MRSYLGSGLRVGFIGRVIVAHPVVVQTRVALEPLPRKPQVDTAA